MPILTGKRLGPYEILSAIGAGGMGEVYRAKDTRLDRIVAVKVLPSHLADSSELRERFEREARTIASLNHPHICTLYDIGHQDGTDFLVMEYLEGDTLAQRLVKGALPLEQVLQYAIEIADALDKARRRACRPRLSLAPGQASVGGSQELRRRWYWWRSEAGRRRASASHRRMPACCVFRSIRPKGAPSSLGMPAVALPFRRMARQPHLSRP
jgi:serine/threonine protein kinase